MKSYFIRFLQAELDLIREKNPRFSQRAFARKLNLDPSLLLALLAGRRVPTVKIAKKIVARLKIENPFLEEALLLSVVDPKYGAYESVAFPKLVEAGEDPCSWMDHAVLALVKAPPAKNSKSEIAKLLGVSTQELAPVLERMERQGILKQAGPCVVLLEEDSLRYKGVGNAALDKMQTEYIAKAAEVYQKDPTGRLQILGSTIACNEDRLNEAAKMTRAFVMKLVKFLEDKDSNVVYRINTQLFPVSTNYRKPEPK